MKRLIFLIVGLAMAAPIHSQVTKVGTTAAPFLTIDVGARAVGMGGSFVSVADDATAMFWNPAGIARLSTNEVTLNHTEWIAGINFNYAGGIFLLGEYGTVGVNFTSLSMGEMERTSEFSFLPKGPISGRKGVGNEILGRLVQMSEKEPKRAKKGENRGGF